LQQPLALTDLRDEQQKEEQRRGLDVSDVGAVSVKAGTLKS